MFFNKLTLSCKLLKDFHNKGVIILSEYMQDRKKKTKSFNSVTQSFHKGCKAKLTYKGKKKKNIQLWKPINLSVKIIKFHNKKSKDQGYQMVGFQLTTHRPWHCYLPWNNMSIISLDLETRDQRITNISSYLEEKAHCYTNILHKI